MNPLARMLRRNVALSRLTTGAAVVAVSCNEPAQRVNESPVAAAQPPEAHAPPPGPAVPALEGAPLGVPPTSTAPESAQPTRTTDTPRAMDQDGGARDEIDLPPKTPLSAARNSNTKRGKQEAPVVIKLTGEGNSDASPGAEVAKIVSRKNSALQRCYETWLRTAKEAPRVLKVKATITVGTEGAVTQVQVAGAAPELAACMTEKFTAIRGLPALSAPLLHVQSYEFNKSL